ncbi:hypothetical protein [Planomonospora algeriensis]
MRAGLGRSTGAMAVAAVTLTLAGCGPSGDTLGDPSPAGGGKPASEALADLKKLPVKVAPR